MAITTIRGRTPLVVLGADGRFTLGRSPVKGTIVRASFYSDATLTGAVTNNRTLSVFNGGQTGTGVTSAASKNFTNAVNATAQAETPITLSGTPANLAVAIGDAIVADSLHVGTGIQDNGGAWEVDIEQALN